MYKYQINISIRYSVTGLTTGLRSDCISARKANLYKPGKVDCLTTLPLVSHASWWAGLGTRLLFQRLLSHRLLSMISPHRPALESQRAQEGSSDARTFHDNSGQHQTNCGPKLLCQGVSFE